MTPPVDVAAAPGDAGSMARRDAEPATHAAAHQPFRLARGGMVDRSRPLTFRFDGALLSGLAGDSLASALLANGVRLVGRSFKYHRPRGVLTAGSEEPNALVGLRRGARFEPNTRATVAELFEGLDAVSQHCWPSLGFDLGALNALLAPLIPAGFYYKTFMGPRGTGTGPWMFFERFIRRAAGLGRAPDAWPDPDAYDQRSIHVDVLVVGAGPAGLAAALAAGRAGARVLLADEQSALGGALLRDRATIDGRPADAWVAAAASELARMADVTVLPRTTVFGYYDHNFLSAVERVADHLPEPEPHRPRQRLWQIRAQQVVLATGAVERPIVFADNDRPGVMLASAARTYVNRYAVAPGRRAVVFGGHDDAYRTSAALAAAGITVAAVIDPRAAVGPGAAHARAGGSEILAGHVVTRALGGAGGVRAVEVTARAGGAPRRIDCDLVCVAGGWTPVVHLQSQSGPKPVWDQALAAFVPGAARQAERSAGAARGQVALSACLADGLAAGAAAAQAAGFGDGRAPTAPSVVESEDAPFEPIWHVPSRGGGKRFVDFQDDVTAEDVALAEREGFRSVEHLKRYTTLGMGTDQGKTANVNGLAIMAELRKLPIPGAGTTTFRPPYTPVTWGALAGREVGLHFNPIRRTAIHDWHVANGAPLQTAGLWLRPRWYVRRRNGRPETWQEASQREAVQVRNGVGICDVSTLGKIELQGPDVIELLNRVYCNGFSTLAVGKARYGLMLREDGLVLDDGTVARLAEDRIFLTTTTANAIKVMQHLEYYLQVVWPELRVQATSVTEQWTAIAVSGPQSRALLARLADADVGDASLPHMGVIHARVAGVPARVFRISFTGERAFEVNVPSDRGLHVWEALMAAGKDMDIMPYGLEAMGTMRIEKGHPAGAELDGRTTPDDLGMGRLVSTKKEFVGRRGLERPGLKDPARQKLVGLMPADRQSRLRGGMQVVADRKVGPPNETLGHTTSSAMSPTLGHPVALALVSGGLARRGERLWAVSPVTGMEVEVEVTAPCFVDPEGRRLHG